MANKYTTYPLKLSKAKQKTVFHLPIEQEIFVPSTSKSQKVIRQKAYAGRVANVRNYLAKLFGGYTSVKGAGGYYSPDEKRVIKEPVAVITSFAQADDFPKKQKQLFRQLGVWRRSWGQESMGYELEGDMYYFGKQKRRRLRENIRRLRRKR